MRLFRRRRHDPLITALLNKLPRPGEVWSQDRRDIWFRLMSDSFDLVYRDKAIELVDTFKRQAAE
jgi:hypothetical protein